MTGEQRLVDDVPVRRFEYDDAQVLAADLGAASDATVDAVDGTAIVVAGEETYEVDLPTGDAQAFIHNGVLTVEVTNADQEDDS